MHKSNRKQKEKLNENITRFENQKKIIVKRHADSKNNIYERQYFLMKEKSGEEYVEKSYV